jgi:GDP-L-fucose synthase
MEDKRNILITGGDGLVGNALLNFYSRKDDLYVLSPRKNQLDLTSQIDVSNFLKKNTVSDIFIAAGKVGGINANRTYPADFININLYIVLNLITEAYKSNIQKVLYFGSSCIYPKQAKQPMNEKELLSGLLEPTNEAYAIAKITGLKLCESYNNQFNTDYRSVMPTNLYGPGDNYIAGNCHVIPALISRFHESMIEERDEIEVWGTGNVYREFLYVDDLIEACDLVMSLSRKDYYEVVGRTNQYINIGFGSDITIKDLAHTISEIIGYKGKIKFDTSMPDGTKRKLLDSSRIFDLGWKPKHSFEDGLRKTYKDFVNNKKLRK